MKINLLFFFFTVISFGQTQDKFPNIILMIGDGMGLTQISTGMYANNNETALEKFDHIGLSKTHALGNLVTDSAASGTAMATGVKTYNGVVGIDSKNVSKKSILEFCKDQGYYTALLATSSIVHATPASFYAKVSSRNMYDEIALQLSKHDVDLFVGGGSKYFNEREDKRNLKTEMKSYDFVDNINQFEKSTSKEIGFLTYLKEPPSLIDGRKPALEDLTKISLKKMNDSEKPFFMMIEGSQIDWGGHANNLNYVISEFNEFNKTIQQVLEFAKSDGNTLVIVTADHETGGLTLSSGNLKKSKVKGKFGTGGHSAVMVPVFSFGPKAELFSGIYENTAIFDKMLETIKN
jgi:alkaline phosphatase